MRRKEVEAIPVPEFPEDIVLTEWYTIAQRSMNLLVLNIFKYGVLRCRHCIDTITGEYGGIENGKWNKRNICDAYGIKVDDAEEYWRTETAIHKWEGTDEDAGLIIRSLRQICDRTQYRRYTNPIEMVADTEHQYKNKIREHSRKNHLDKVNDIMDIVDAATDRLTMDDIFTAFYDMELGGYHFCLKNTDGEWKCTNCSSVLDYKTLRTKGGKKPKDRDLITCPKCGETLKILKRKRNVEAHGKVNVLQDLNDTMAVSRWFDVQVICENGQRYCGYNEAIRLILWKDFTHPVRVGEDIYYNQRNKQGEYPGYGYYSRINMIPQTYENTCAWDNVSNPANRREGAGYLVQNGEIQKALGKTVYWKYGKLFEQMADQRLKVDYNRLMKAYGTYSGTYPGKIEMLFRNGFWQIIRQEADKIDLWDGKPHGAPRLNLDEDYMPDIFGLDDKQQINRLRDMNGSLEMLEWLRWAQRHHTKVSDKFLAWAQKNKVNYSELKYAALYMSPEKLMNYFTRQQRESYPTLTMNGVINQYEDYMDMAKQAGQDLTDEMVHRPRQLKLRHDRIILILEERKADIQEEEYRKRYPGVAEVLQRIKPKFEYTGEKYMIVVPQRIADIVREGQYMHHCTAWSQRYYDRMLDDETYIVFCRRKEEPDIPWYTIEVEPGGAIRQQRGFADEKPEFDDVKPFLREWQEEIKNRMKEEDREKAKVSARKREENIEELKALTGKDRKDRVLQGLLADFMAAV